MPVSPAAPQPDEDLPGLENVIHAPAEPVAAEVRYGTAAFSRASAIAIAEAIASQQSQVRAGASSPLNQDQLQRNRTDFIDQWDSRWQRG